MKTAFLCERCRTRLIAKASMAGRTSRCPKCGKAVVVPAAAPTSQVDWRSAVSQQLDPLATPPTDAEPAVGESGYRLKTLTPVGLPQLDAKGRPAAAKRASGTTSASPANASEPAKPALSRQPGQQKTADATPRTAGVAARGKSLIDETEDELRSLFGDADEVEFEFNPPELVVAPSQVRSGFADVLRVYRSAFSLLARGTKGISEASYTVSFILLILAIAGGVMGNHGLASLGLGLIVLLNVVGFVGDLASLVMLSFRKDPMQGLLFLLPPYAAYYLWTDWKRYQDVVGRMRIPLLMLGGVAAAYAFVPWLGGAQQPDPPAETAEVAAGELQQDAAAAEPPSAAPQGDASVGYGVGFVESAADWVWSLVGGEPTQLFHVSEPRDAEPTGDPPQAVGSESP